MSNNFIRDYRCFRAAFSRGNRCWNRKYTSVINVKGSKDNKTRDHLIRTGESFRQHTQMVACVTEIKDLSPSVKGLKLQVRESDGDDTQFKAGQWIDMFIDGVDTVGGFSICSSPLQYQSDKVIELAVKFSDHPPANWIHTTCDVGSNVKIRFGGDFFYDPQDGKDEDLLLIAGGVGINPIYSILRHRSNLLSKTERASSTSTTLLYTARSLEELLFKDRIEQITRKLPNSSCKFFVTHNHSDKHMLEGSKNIRFGRINEKSLATEIGSPPTKPVCYVCGPPGFIDFIKDAAIGLGVDEQNVKYEKWW